MHVTMISTLLHGNVAANTPRRAHAACPSEEANTPPRRMHRWDRQVHVSDSS